VPLQEGGQADAIASPAETIPTPDLHSVFAKELHLDESPSSALLHLFAFTRYRLYVNGVYVGRGPCRFQNQRPEYDTRDIRTHLNPGRNAIVVLVHRDAPTGRIMKHAPGFIAALEMVQSGKRQVIRTDATWRSMPERSFGSRTQAWSSIEENIDARRTSDWTQPDLTAGTWQPSAVTAESGQMKFYPRSSPMQMETLLSWSAATPVFPVEMVVGSPVSFRLAEIAQAFHLLELDADEGSEFVVTYCLPEGAESGRSTYIARTGRQTYMGGDTFAFQSLQITLKSGRARLARAAAYEVRYPFERVGSFACSDPFLTQLWGICARSLEVLSEDSYVDCADRERVEWTDDSPPAFDCTRVIMRGPDEEGKTYWGDSRLLRGLLRRIALTQQPDGQLKAHSCSERFDIHAIMEDRSCDWVVQLREYHESSGDSELVRELWPTLMRLMLWYRQRRTPRGLTLAREWEVWDNPLRYEVCEGAGLNAMVYRALVDASVLASSIGKKRDSQMLSQEADRLRVDYNHLLWNEGEGAYDGALFGPGSEIRPQMGQPFTGKITNGRFRPTAQANLFALYAGIVPPERISSTRNWVLAHKQQIYEPMSCYYLFRMLYAMNDEQQEREAVNFMKTAWQNQVDSEWQTSWEELEKGGGSKVHIYGMHPAYFLTAFVLGARREGPVSQRTLLIEPRFSGLEWARGICVTEFGPVRMEWSVNSSTESTFDCTIPAGISAKLRLRSLGERTVTAVDGASVSPHEENGWLEIGLQPGQHTIHMKT
jgi:alpha-L-rhamnosidase